VRVTHDATSALAVQLFHDRAVVGAFTSSELLFFAILALSASNVEGCDDAITRLDRRHRRPDLLNDTHAFVAQNLVCLELEDLSMVQMQI